MKKALLRVKNLLTPVPQHFELAGKVALITGGADGIGLATAKNLKEKGALVVIVDRDKAAAQVAATSLGSSHAIAIGADVTDRRAMRSAVDQAIKHFGRLDIVVANAGISPTPSPIRTMDLENFDRVLAVNLTGVLNTVHPAIEELIRRQGHILVVASVAAFCPPMCGVAYGASKAAVEQLGRALKVELAQHGVSVTVSYFGVVDTLMTQNALDLDPVGAEMDKKLPMLFRKRITPQRAAAVLVDAISHRAERSMAPMQWELFSRLRGVVNPVLDRVLATDPKMQEITVTLEKRSKKPLSRDRNNAVG